MPISSAVTGTPMHPLKRAGAGFHDSMAEYSGQTWWLEESRTDLTLSHRALFNPHKNVGGWLCCPESHPQGLST